MNNYELVLLFKPDMEDEDRNNVLSKVLDAVRIDGKEEKVDEWGIRKLAYEINYIKEAYYVVIYFEANPNSISEIERIVKIQDSIIRHMVVKVES